MDCKINLVHKNSHEEANIFSKLFLWWCFPLFIKGYKYGFTFEELWKVRACDRSGMLGNRLEQEWNKEVQQARINDTSPSLGKAIVRSFGIEYLLCGIGVGILYIIVWPIVPYSLALFVGYFSGTKTHDAIKYAHINNLIMNLSILTVPLLVSHLELLQGCVGMRARIACCSLVYRKVLKLNHSGLNKTESGQIINLMSNDVSRFDMAAIYLHYMWVMPVLVIYVSYLVWQHVAWATLAGLGVIFVQTLLMQSYLSVAQTNLRKKIAKRTDERVKVISELINGMQVIKMCAWEKSFEKLVAKLRKYEMKFIFRTSVIKGLSTAFIIFTERLVLFAAVVAFTACGGDIRSAVAFSLVQYYNLLQRACNIYFPWGLTFFGESKISVKRLEEFLLLEDMENNEIGLINSNDKTSNHKESLESNHNCQEKSSAGFDLIAASACWQPTAATHTLKNITLNVKSGEFVGIVGSVGSGKTSLLQVMMGELPLSGGEILLRNAKISYASQETWLFSGTVRQNVLFGLPYNKSFYDKVIHACALLHDLEQLPAGDASVVGERGVSLSGGQRARIALARACYRKADIYLLDDPLSAVDTHVGKQFVSECVMGLLRHSTRILVTHQLHHLKTADKIIIIEKGEILAQGTYQEMSEMPIFRQMAASKEPDINDSTDTHEGS